MASIMRNGKEYSNVCFNCGESKAAIVYSRQRKDPIYCAIVGSDTEGGYGEVEGEYDHHRFVRTLKQKAAEEAAERAYAEQMNDFASFMEGE